LLKEPGQLEDSSMLVLPGGFSFGDEIASGRVLAIKLLSGIKESLLDYIEQGRLVVGICNGFQTLAQMGLLPSILKDESDRFISLKPNMSGRFINKWVELEVPSTAKTGYFAGLSQIVLPIRHGEGRVASTKEKRTLVEKHCCLKYSKDINGSQDRIAALVSEKGNILGMMPHPEAFVRWTQHPAWTQMKVDSPDLLKVSDPDGLLILKNACNMAKAL
ncbi:MAG: phosphoribosylformylglycinamidine synthase subunit PurQ, partial [Candidatus Obscuribacterales bacterium]|nr:phosphoribosylformylglycinamidine synthase subunit PurQ [Candidatus Obscuribacterales bacterium]